MTTADVISGVTLDAPVTKKRKVKGVEVKVTRAEPTTVKVVDETVKPESFTRQPIDEGKVKIEVMPGLNLWKYSRGYYVLEQKGKDFHGRKTTVRRVIYRDDIKAIVEALFAAGQDAKSYEEAHGTVPF